jgi:hypothetical protein
MNFEHNIAKLFFYCFCMMTNNTLQYPKTLQHDFLALYWRYGMTPSFISSLLMLVILPAKLDKENMKCLDKGLHEDEPDIPHVLVPKNSDTYTVYFGGNAQDCLNEEMLKSIKVSSNCIFWNYPGVKNNLASHSPEELYKAGYLVVKKLINQGIPAHKIILHGLSLGGNIAAEVARRLYREGNFVNLHVFMSFSTVSWVIPESIRQKSKSKKTLIYISSIFSVSAFILMIVGLAASIINTITLILMNTLAMLSYVIAFTIQSPGILLQESMNIIGFEKLGTFLAMPWIELGKLFNQMMNFFAESINDLIWGGGRYC